MDSEQKLRSIFMECFIADRVSSYSEDIIPAEIMSQWETRFNAWWNVHSERVKLDLNKLGKNDNIIIEPTTPYDNETANRTGQFFMWEDYRGWRGRIIRDDLNGETKAYMVHITQDGKSYITITINADDVKLLHQTQINS